MPFPVNEPLSISCIYRFSRKIRQLNEGGIINHWKEIELNKVGKSSAGAEYPDPYDF